MAKNSFDSLAGAFYSWYIEQPWLTRPVAAIIWGGDVRPYYELLESASALEPGTVVVDCPCGAGAALDDIPPHVDYTGIDASTEMLRRAGKRANASGHDPANLRHGDASDLPLDDASVDVFYSHWGLHCFDDPEGAVAEIGRVLKPGGRAVVCSFVTGPSLRQRVIIRENVGAFGRVATEHELTTWLKRAGLAGTPELRGSMLYFEGVKQAD